jgi:hypothetical protein
MITTAAVFAAAMSLLGFGQGVAEADSAIPNVIGKTFGEAKGLLGQAGMTPVVATVLGDRASSQDQCYVVSMTKMTPLDSSGKTAQYNQVQVNLNCYTGQSDTKSPGYSKANLAPDAVAVRDTHDAADKAWKASPEGQKWCAKFEGEHPEYVPVPGCHSEAEEKELAQKKWLASPDGQAWCAQSETDHPDWAPIAGCHPEQDASAT